MNDAQPPRQDSPSDNRLETIDRVTSWAEVLGHVLGNRQDPGGLLAAILRGVGRIVRALLD